MSDNLLTVGFPGGIKILEENKESGKNKSKEADVRRKIKENK